jgi:hypothetical protein
MMTRLTATDTLPTLRLDLVDATVGTTPRAAELAPLLFGLGLAMALPPAAILAPPQVVLPTIRSDAHAILDSVDLGVVLDRSIAGVGHGRVAPGEVDKRLGGLVVSLDVFRITGGTGPGAGALVSLGTVRPDPVASGDHGATTADLWRLACAALMQDAIPGGHLNGFGDDAFLAVYGGTTAQIAWMAGDHLATASVTCLAGEESWAIEAAYSIAAFLDHRPSR